MNTLQLMEHNPNVRVKPLEEYPGVFACNFTRRAFFSGSWDQETIKARGLFLDSDGNVVARGYEKFFNIGEPQGYQSLDEFFYEAADNPIFYSKKWNGFLVIISAIFPRGAHQPELVVFSKGGVTPFSVFAQQRLQGILRLQEIFPDEEQVYLASILLRNNVSLTAECVSLEHDPHIVNDGEAFVILDAIDNTLEFSQNYDVLATIKELFPLLTINNLYDTDEERFAQVVENAGVTEGFVLYYLDKNGTPHFAKVKTDAYVQRKKLRNIIQKYLRGGSLKPDEVRQLENLRDLCGRDTFDETLSNYQVTNLNSQLVFNMARFADDYNL